MTATSWSSRHQEARDAAWAAWRRLDLEPYEMEFSNETPTPLRSIAKAIVAAIVEPAQAVIDEFDADFDVEARRRIILEAAMKSTRHVAWAIVEAIANEAARPAPMPFDPPPAGSWLRCRDLPRPSYRRLASRLSPEWSGAWHVFGGDIQPGDARWHDIYGRARCGVRLHLRGFGMSDTEPSVDYVIADERPGVDACRRCEPMRSRLRLVTA